MTNNHPEAVLTPATLSIFMPQDIHRMIVLGSSAAAAWDASEWTDEDANRMVYIDRGNLRVDDIWDSYRRGTDEEKAGCVADLVTYFKAQRRK